MRPGQEFRPLANCHAPGIFSIPLHRSVDSVERMFIDTLGNARMIAPHNHRYSLNLRVVHGEMRHVVWFPSDDGPFEMRTFSWHPPTAETSGFFALLYRPQWFKINVSIMTADDEIELESHEYHSLETTPGTSWVVTEGVDERDTSQALWHEPTYAPDLSGLYVPIGDPL